MKKGSFLCKGNWRSKKRCLRGNQFLWYFSVTASPLNSQHLLGCTLQEIPFHTVAFHSYRFLESTSEGEIRAETSPRKVRRDEISVLFVGRQHTNLWWLKSRANSLVKKCPKRQWIFETSILSSNVWKHFKCDEVIWKDLYGNTNGKFCKIHFVWLKEVSV